MAERDADSAAGVEPTAAMDATAASSRSDAPAFAPGGPESRGRSAFSTASGRFWLVASAGLALLAIVIASWSVVFVFGVGAAIALLLLPLVNWLERKGLGRTLAAGLLVLVTVLVAALLTVLIFAIIINQGIPFVQSLPVFVADLYAQLTALGLPPALQTAIDALFSSIDGALASIEPGSLALGFFVGVLGFVAGLLSLLIVPFFIFYLVRDQPAIAADVSAAIPASMRPHITAVVHILRTDFANYFKAELMVGGIMGVIVTIGMIVIGAIVGGPLGDFALILGLIAATMEFIPTVGPIISMIPALLIAVTISPMAFVLVLIFYLVAFQVESAILVPTLEGQIISFRPATILLLIAVGFGIGGIIGAIVVLPTAAISRDLFRYFFDATTPRTAAATATAMPAPELSPVTD